MWIHLKGEPKYFTDGLGVGYEREGSKMCPKFLYQTVGRMGLPFNGWKTIRSSLLGASRVLFRTC